MACTITGTLATFDNSDVARPLVGFQVVAIPSVEPVKQIIGNLMVVYPSRPSATTDSAGTFSLPLISQAETDPPGVTWKLVLANDNTIGGAVPSIASADLRTLRITYGWT